MRKRLTGLLTCCSLLLALCGCWSYTSLDQMDIVVGIAIDFEEATKSFSIGYETADLNGADKQGSVSGKIVTAKGKTLFDTARNAKRNEADRLFFGSAHVLIISQQLAEENKILPIIEWFLRDGECRESMCVAISQEKTAKVILESPEDMKGIMSMTLHDIIREDKSISVSSLNMELYEIYNRLQSPRRSVVLPALHRVENGGKITSGINGVAVVKEDGLAGFLSPEQSKYVVLLENQMSSGIFTLSMSGEGEDDTSLEVFGSETAKDFTYEQGKLTFRIHSKIKAAVGENQGMMDMMDKEQVQQIQEAAQRKIEKNIRALLDVLQQEYKADIFGLGEMVYHKNFSLWKELEPDWNQIYPTLEIKVSAEVQVINSGFLN